MKPNYISPETLIIEVDTTTMLSCSPSRDDNPYWHDDHAGRDEPHNGYWDDRGKENGWGEWGKP